MTPDVRNTTRAQLTHPCKSLVSYFWIIILDKIHQHIEDFIPDRYLLMDNIKTVLVQEKY